MSNQIKELEAIIALNQEAIHKLRDVFSDVQGMSKTPAKFSPEEADDMREGSNQKVTDAHVLISKFKHSHRSVIDHVEFEYLCDMIFEAGKARGRMITLLND